MEPFIHMAYTCICAFGGSDAELDRAALGVLRCVARLRRRFHMLGSRTCMQQFVAHARSTLCPDGTGRPPNHRLSCANQALLWEYLGVLAHELIAPSRDDAVASPDVGRAYIVEVRFKILKMSISILISYILTPFLVMCISICGSRILLSASCCGRPWPIRGRASLRQLLPRPGSLLRVALPRALGAYRPLARPAPQRSGGHHRQSCDDG